MISKGWVPESRGGATYRATGASPGEGDGQVLAGGLAQRGQGAFPGQQRERLPKGGRRQAGGLNHVVKERRTDGRFARGARILWVDPCATEMLQ